MIRFIHLEDDTPPPEEKFKGVDITPLLMEKVGWDAQRQRNVETLFNELLKRRMEEKK